jgi:epsilon-lactone hydrolase
MIIDKVQQPNKPAHRSIVVIVALILTCYVKLAMADERQVYIPETVSPQAQEFIKKNKPGLVSGEYTVADGDKVQVFYIGATRPAVEELRKSIVEKVENIKLNGVPVTVVTPKGYKPINDKKAAIYLHGGAYVLGQGYDETALNMAYALGVKVFAVDYRLAPRYQYPAGLDDSVAVYRALLKTYKPKNMVVVGVSAGGGLAISMVLKARDSGLPLPAATALFSPWADLSGVGDTYHTAEGFDPVLTWDNQLKKMAVAYVGSANAKDPLVSPIYADYKKGFPRTIISAGTRDLLLSNSVLVHRALKRAGVSAELNVWEGMWHAFDIATGIPEGNESRKEIASFLIKSFGK